MRDKLVASERLGGPKPDAGASRAEQPALPGKMPVSEESRALPGLQHPPGNVHDVVMNSSNNLQSPVHSAVVEPLPKLLKETDVADIFGVSDRWVRHWEAQGLIKAMKLGRRTKRYHPAEVQRFIDANGPMLYATTGGGSTS